MIWVMRKASDVIRNRGGWGCDVVSLQPLLGTFSM